MLIVYVEFYRPKMLYPTRLIIKSCVNTSYVLHIPGSSGLMVKDEYDYDCPSSLPSSEGHIQTIQHPPTRPMPEPAFSSPALLPPTEGSSSASTSAFSSIPVGSSSKTFSFLSSHFPFSFSYILILCFLAPPTHLTARGQSSQHLTCLPNESKQSL